MLLCRGRSGIQKNFNGDYGGFHIFGEFCSSCLFWRNFSRISSSVKSYSNLSEKGSRYLLKYALNILGKSVNIAEHRQYLPISMLHAMFKDALLCTSRADTTLHCVSKNGFWYPLPQYFVMKLSFNSIKN